MSILDLFGSGEHSRNLGHFASIVNIAASDGDINELEEAYLERFARKLDITEEEYNRILQNPGEFPINPDNSSERRLERLHDLFTVVYSDHEIAPEETHLIKKYAIGLGFSNEAAKKIITRSIQIFSGKIGFEDYVYLLKSK
ncbi:MAG TPA: TerB family tellurite resistance protein [Salinimicrobium sp.]|nr:TerB family tellurite resistance protein [Salinimicrobium sp.]